VVPVRADDDHPVGAAPEGHGDLDLGHVALDGEAGAEDAARQVERDPLDSAGRAEDVDGFRVA
jgi:hypothetical protein